MMRSFLKHSLVIMCLCSLAACATNGPPGVGTRPWHEERLAEIEQAHQLGDISEAEYLQLKNEADQIRVDFRSALVRSRQRTLVIGGAFGHRH